MNMPEEINCIEGNGSCYKCPHTEKCEFWKYLMGRKGYAADSLTYFEKKELIR